MTQPHPQTFLFLLEDSTLRHIANEQSPDMAYSHDRCMLHMAHETLKKGHTVYITPRVRNNRFRRISRVYPSWQVDEGETETLQPDVVVGIEFSACGYKTAYPRAKIAAMHAALYYVENPEMFCDKRMFNLLIHALPRQMDFIIVQNQRMKDIILPVYMLMGWEWPERLVVAPFGYVKEQMVPEDGREAMRKQIGLQPSDIAIINAGGIWKWTDFNNFLLAFIKSVREGAEQLKLVLPGMRQPENDDHGDYIRETQAIFDQNPDLMGKNIILLERWMPHAELRKVVAACDVGLSVSRDGLEHWQSHRVRVLEYIQAGIPFIGSYGDSFSHDLKDAIYPVYEGDFAGVFQQLTGNQTLLRQKSESMREQRQRYASDVSTARLIDLFISSPLLERKAAPQHPQAAPAPVVPAAAPGWREIPVIADFFRFARHIPFLGWALSRASRLIRRLEGGQTKPHS